MMADERPPAWWQELDRHRDAESRARHDLEERRKSATEALEARVNALESWVDRWQGAQRLIGFLIGTNVLVAIATVLGIVVALRA